MNLIDELKRFCMEKDISVTQLATILGRGRCHMSRVINGKESAGPRLEYKIKKLLGIRE